MRKSILLIAGIALIIGCRNVEKEKNITPAEKTKTKEEKSNAVTVEQKPDPVMPHTAVQPKKAVAFHPPNLKEKATSHNTPQAVLSNETEFKQLGASLNANPQTFSVTSIKVTTIKAEKGTELTVDPSDLVTEDGKPVTGPITITVKEFPDKLDMLKVNSQTTSDGKLLVSGGAYYIDMTSNNSPVRLKEGKTLEAYFPGMKEKGMEIFYGSKNPDGTMNWIKPAEALSGKQKPIKQSTEFDRLQNLAGDLGTLRTYQIIIKPQELQFFVEVSRTDNQITRKLTPVTRTERKFIGDQLYKARFSYPAYKYSLEDDGITGYYFYTDDSQIFVDKTVLTNPNSVLNAEELKVLREPIDRYNAQTKPIRDAQQVTSYLQNASGLTKFGWINCDRFYTDTSMKKDFIVSLKYPDSVIASSVNVFMVFKNINSLISGNYLSEGRYSFNQIPSVGEVSLIAITKLNGRILAGKTSYLNLARYSNYVIKMEEIPASKVDPLINSL